MKCRAETQYLRGLRFPVPLDKGNEGSGNEIGKPVILVVKRYACLAFGVYVSTSTFSCVLKGQDDVPGYLSPMLNSWRPVVVRGEKTKTYL